MGIVERSLVMVFNARVMCRDHVDKHDLKSRYATRRHVLFVTVTTHLLAFSDFAAILNSLVLDAYFQISSPVAVV
jgi:hypothetical protein